MKTHIPQDKAMKRRAALASGVGAVMDWYDFFLYGIASALVFNKVFFPTFDSTAGTIASFGTLAIGFFCRPIGGAIFGHFGDRIGRKNMLVLTMILMGGASTLIGLLPTFDAIGVAAPILLITLRAVQGFAVGGEWGGASLMAVEHAPRGRKGLYGCVVQVGASVGLLLANGAFGIVDAITSDEQFLAWGWRIPFLISAVIVVAGFIIRRGVAESPEFQQVKLQGAEQKVPLWSAMKAHPMAFVRIFGMRFGELVGFYIVTSFLLNYATTGLGVSRSLILTATLVAAAGGILANPLFAMLGDRIGWNRMYMIGSAIGVVAAVPLFWGVATGIPVIVIVAVAFYINISHDAMVSVQQPLFTEMFSADTRYSGAGFASQVASAIIAGTAPLIAIFLVQANGGGWAYLAMFLIAASLISIWAAASAPAGDKHLAPNEATEEVKDTQQPAQLR